MSSRAATSDRRALGSTNAFKASRTPGFVSLSDLRPPPGRRTRSTGVVDGASSSFNPRPIVLAATPVTRDTAAMPPYPVQRRAKVGHLRG